MTSRMLPRFCPSCGEALVVKRFACHECGTAVEGEFQLSILAKLEPDEQEFLLNLLEESGSLKGLARKYGVSYPTVRNRLDALRAKVGGLRQGETDPLEN